MTKTSTSKYAHALLLAVTAIWLTTANAETPDMLPGSAKITTQYCALPSQIRQLGNSFTYLPPRKLLITDTADCARQGGKLLPLKQRSQASA